MPWHQTPSRKKKAVVFTIVTTSTYQDQLNAGFSKLCEKCNVPAIYCSGLLLTPKKIWITQSLNLDLLLNRIE